MFYKRMKILIPILFLPLISCDFTTTGEICNQKNELIELVVSPFNNPQKSILKNDRLEYLKWDTVNQTGYFRLQANSCAPVAEGINSFAPEEITFNHIEIRSSTDTLIVDDQNEIHKRFEKINKNLYQWKIK